MPFVAPWLKPTDVLGAIEGGASAGLRARQIGDSEAAQQSEQQSAAARLKYSYDSLAASTAAEKRQEALKAQAIQASAALKKSQMDLMNQYRLGQQQIAKQHEQDQMDARTAAQKLTAKKEQDTILTKGLPTEDAASVMQASDPAIAAQIASLAGERQTVHKQNEADKASAAAILRGDVPTTTIGPKGQTVTYKPPTRAQGENEPQSKVLPDGTTVVFMPNGTGLHVIPKEKPKVLSTSQLLAVAKALPDEDPDKTNLVNMAKSAVMPQISPKPVAPPQSTPVAGNPDERGASVKVKVGQVLKGPDGKLHRVKVSGDLPDGYTVTD